MKRIVLKFLYINQIERSYFMKRQVINNQEKA